MIFIGILSLLLTFGSFIVNVIALLSKQKKQTFQPDKPYSVYKINDAPQSHERSTSTGHEPPTANSTSTISREI
ncbi:hypothetical protein BDV96DRAFT_588718 [Lophiotrema nucula]|uniref:Uncharacterized protein n=1 Tax=Lophiotrema nucula TaxID=690887 RepID=A0A6A5YNK0_9PLEO|nr:hypothetical protein BDV96DRAFT_588718 [Lophiotrema nucula]